MLSRFAWVGVLVVAGGAMLIGCDGRPSLFPNRDQNLRKTAQQFAADAAKRHPMNTDLPAGGEAVGRAQVGYALNKLEIWNGSDEDWINAEIWVNRSYVCFVPKIQAKAKRTTMIEFEMLYDANGQHFPTDNRSANLQVRQLEMVKDGKIYTIPLRLAD